MKVTAGNGGREAPVELRDAFRNFRNSSGQSRPRYPEALRQRALSMISSGASLDHVAEICGVNRQSLVNWKQALRPQPRKLQIIGGADGRRAAPTDVTVPVTSAPVAAELRFPSGLVMSVAFDAAALSLLRELGGLGPC